MENVEVLESNVNRTSTWAVELKKLGGENKAEGFRVIFGSAKGLRDSVGVKNRPCLLPWELLGSLEKDLNGLYGTRCVRDGTTKTKAYDVWYTFKVKQVSTCKRTGKLSYAWEQVACFAMHDVESRCFRVLCLDCPKHVRMEIEDKLSTSSLSQSIPWHETFLDAMRDLYDDSVWSLRHCIRDSERSRTSLSASDEFQPDFVHLHEIARHVIHSNECLDVAIDTAERILKDFKRRSQPDSDETSNFLSRISALEKDLRGIKRRSASLQERLQNEINLAYNLVAQRDSRIMVRMGERSRQDNNNMRSIAVVGLVYLPGTFVSGMFGMNFFDFSEESGHQSWKVSNKLWMYWAITLPLTLVTILVWVLAFHGDALKWPVVRRKKALEAANAKGP